MKNIKVILFSAVLVALSGCAQEQLKPEDPESRQKEWERAALESSVDIQYVLGHNQHRLMAHSDPASVSAKTLLNRDMLEKGSVDRARYLAFLKKAADFAKNRLQTKTPSDLAPACRTPFTITV